MFAPEISPWSVCYLISLLSLCSPYLHLLYRLLRPKLLPTSTSTSHTILHCEAQPIHPHPLHCRSFTRRLISDPSPNPFTDSPSPSTNLIRPIPKSLYRPISKSLYRFTLTLNRFNQTHLQIPLPIHPHRVTHLFKPTLKGFWVWVTLHSITLSSNRHSRVLDFCFSVCVSFLSLQEKERFSLCLCLVFDQRFVVDVCRGEIQLHHGGFSLSSTGLAPSESLHTRFSLSSSIPVSFSLRFPSV